MENILEDCLRPYPSQVASVVGLRVQLVQLREQYLEVILDSSEYVKDIGGLAHL